jgi:hypothetical protein
VVVEEVHLKLDTNLVVHQITAMVGSAQLVQSQGLPLREPVEAQVQVILEDGGVEEEETVLPRTPLPIQVVEVVVGMEVFVPQEVEAQVLLSFRIQQTGVMASLLLQQEERLRHQEGEQSILLQRMEHLQLYHGCPRFQPSLLVVEAAVVTVTVQEVAQVDILKMQTMRSQLGNIQLSLVLVEQVLHLQEEDQTERPVHLIHWSQLAAEVEREALFLRVVMAVQEAEQVEVDVVDHPELEAKGMMEAYVLVVWAEVVEVRSRLVIQD